MPRPDDVLEITVAEMRAAIRKARRAAYRKGEATALTFLKSVSKLNGSAAPLLKGLSDPAPADTEATVFADPIDPHAALYEALLAAVIDARESGDDDAVAGLVDAYREHLDDPETLTAALAGAGSDDAIAKAIGRVLLKAGKWSADKHPRDDSGRFVSRDAIADAKGDPAKEEVLRDKVTDPEERAKLDNALAGTTDLGRTKAGQRKHEAGQRREKRAASHARAAELADKIGGGTATPEDMHELGDHLEGLTVDKLRALQSRIPTAGRTRRKAEMVAALRDSLEKSAHMKRVTDGAAGVGGRAGADAPRLALAGLLPNRYDVTTADGEVVKAGTGYQRFEGQGKAVGYTAAQAAQVAAGVTPDHADRRIQEHERAASAPDLDDVQREYHATIADQLRGHKETVFGGEKPAAAALESLTPAALATGEPPAPAGEGHIAAYQQAKEMIGTPGRMVGGVRMKQDVIRAAAKQWGVDEFEAESRLENGGNADQSAATTPEPKQPETQSPDLETRVREAASRDSFVQAADRQVSLARAEVEKYEQQAAAHRKDAENAKGAPNYGEHVRMAKRADSLAESARKEVEKRTQVRNETYDRKARMARSVLRQQDAEAQPSDLAPQPAAPQPANFASSPAPVAGLTDDELRAEQRALPRRTRTVAQGERDREIARELARRNPLPAGGGTPVMTGGGKGPGVSDAENEGTAAKPTDPASAHAATLPEGSPARAAIEAAVANGGGDKRRTLKELGHRHAEMAAQMNPEEESGYVEMMGKHGVKPLHEPGQTVPFDPETMHSDTGVSSGAPVKVVRRGWTGLYGDAKVGHENIGNNYQRAQVEPAASATVGTPPEAKPAPAKSGNSPAIQSTPIDTGKGTGDTTPVPATPAGGGGTTMTTTEKPDLFHYTGDAEFGPLAGVSLRNGVRVKNHPQAGDAIVFDQVKHNGKFITPTVRLAGKPKLQAAWDSHEKAHADYAAGQRAKLEANVPGLDALKAAVSGEERYNRQFDRMMNDENNDGARPPASPRGPSSRELAAKHPRAAAYLRAEGYANAAHDQKAAAGKRAMELLAAGGSVEDADAILKNWLPATAWEN